MSKPVFFPALSHAPPVQPAVDASASVTALRDILASEEFSRAQRMSKLLRFLVEQRLSGDAGGTSEYAIGIDVFDRDPATYSTCDDPIVRVQVGRLREKLRQYYCSSGRQTGVRFSIPIGSYMPEIELMHTIPPVVKGKYLLAIAPLAVFTKNTTAVAFTQGLNEELAYHLFKAFGQTIVSYTVAPQHDASGISHRLEGSVRVHGELMRSSIRLIDSAAGCIVWSQQFDYCAALALPLQELLAADICRELEQYFALG